MNKITNELKMINDFIENSTNIYDLYIQLYFYLSKKEATIIDLITRNISIFSEYRLSIENEIERSSFTDVLTVINRTIIKDFIYANKDDYILVVAALFTSIDIIFGTQDYRYGKDITDLPEHLTEMFYLNTNKTTNLGKVYYKTKSIPEKLYNKNHFIRQNKHIDLTIRALQENLLVYVEPNNDYKIRLYKLNSPYIIDQLKEKKDCLRIAMIPLTADNDYIDFLEKENFIYVKTVKHTEKYKIRIINILEKLKTEKVDIVVFPEMVMTEDILLHIRHYLHYNKGYFTLIIAGSIWMNNKNQCAIVSGDGIELLRQLKLNRYHKSISIGRDGNNEGIDISSENRYINILDINHLGRIATPICADFIAENYFNELEKTGVNFAFIPAYTPQLHQFKTKAERLGYANYGCSFVCNCCIPIVNSKDRVKLNENVDISICFVPLKGKYINGSNVLTCSPSNHECNYKHNKICYFLTTFTKTACEFNQIKV